MTPEAPAAVTRIEDAAAARWLLNALAPVRNRVLAEPSDEALERIRARVLGEPLTKARTLAA
jgi:hypothetical protein